MRDLSIEEIRSKINITESRDELLTDFGKRTLANIKLEGETFQDAFARPSMAFCGGDEALAQRLYDYSSKLWLSFATPLLANGGASRGLPISCFLNYVHDSLRGLADNWDENVFLATSGGGIGSFWGDIRSLGEVTSQGVETSGMIPFAKCIDTQMLAYKQGNTRRGAAALYLDVSHPEILDFVNMRRPTGGDENRKCLNLHHGVGIPDTFMKAVSEDGPWDLVDPNSGIVHETIAARDLWKHIMTTRLEVGEPYLFFKDTTNAALPEAQKKLGLKVHHSNLCSEITLATSTDRTAVCCLSSLNIDKYDEWQSEQDQFISDVTTMLDNVLDVFITKAPKEMWRAVNSAKKERSIGIGTLGFHTYLQRHNLDIESEEAAEVNEQIFRAIKSIALKTSKRLAEERGEPDDLVGTGVRNAHLMAVAPNATSSIVCGTISPSIEPMVGGLFNQRTGIGTIEVRNPALADLLIEKGKNTDEVWTSIGQNEGSVQHLDFLTQEEKAVFKTAVEIDQFKLVELAAQRQKYICQAQSLNLFLPPNVNRGLLSKLHVTAWKMKLKTLYYLRSDTDKPVEKLGNIIEPVEHVDAPKMECTDDVCTMCEG